MVVESLARTGANITGLSGLQPDLELKRVEFLKEMAPATMGIAALLNMSNPVTAPQLKALERAAHGKGWPFQLFDVRSREDIERAFADLAGSSNAVVVGFEGSRRRTVTRSRSSPRGSLTSGLWRARVR